MSEATTVREFKAWINGILEAHGEKYTPDAKVWKKILKKIQSLPEEQVVLEYNKTNSHSNFNQGQSETPRHFSAPNTNFNTFPSPGSSSLDGAMLPPKPVQHVPLTPASQELPSGNIISSGDPVSKTPHIDTSGGGYTSNFI